MADFNKVTITRKGQDLMTRIMALSKQMSFNSLQISDTAYKEEQLEGLANLDNIKAVIIPRRIDKLDDVTVKVEGIIYNTGLTEGYYLKTLGLTANTPDDESLLYAVASADEPGYLPPYNGKTTMGALIRMIIKVGNSNNLEIKINPSAVATIGELEDLKQELTAKLDKKISNLDNTKADKTDTENKLRDLYVAVSNKADSSTVSINTQSIERLEGQNEELSKTIINNAAADDKKFESKTAHSNDINLLNKSIDTKADKANTYTKAEVNSMSSTKADKSNTYDKTDVDSRLATKADKSNTYTKSEVDNKLSNKASIDETKRLDSHTVKLSSNMPTMSQTDLNFLAPGVQPVDDAELTIDNKKIHYSGLIITTDSHTAINSSDNTTKFYSQFMLTAEGVILRRLMGKNSGTIYQLTQWQELPNENTVEQIEELTNSKIPSLRNEFVDKLNNYVGYSKNYLTSPTDKIIFELPQGIQTVYNFDVGGYFTASGQIITLNNPNAWKDWKQQFFVGVQGQFAVRTIDGNNPSPWITFVDENGTPNRQGLLNAIVDHNNALMDIKDLKNEVAELKRKIK